MGSIACVVLAAGHSSRFGSNKMLHQLQDGASLIETTARQYLALFAHITVVVNCTEKHPLQGHSGIKLVSTEQSSQGLSDSLKAGIRANHDSDAWLIALGDMPYVQVATVGTLRDSLSERNIVVPLFQGRQGNPVGFGAAFKDQLLAVQGDQGAKSIIQQHSDSVIPLVTQDRGVVHDIDIPADIL